MKRGNRQLRIVQLICRIQLTELIVLWFRDTGLRRKPSLQGRFVWFIG